METQALMHATAISLHILSALIWVGGMFFAHVALRPSAVTVLEPPLRLTLWVQVFRRFFPLVWISIVLLLGSGYWIINYTWGNMAVTPIYVHIMYGFGLLMMLIFIFLYFLPYQGLQKAVSAQQWPEGAKHLAKIRQLVTTNLALGLFVSVVAVAGRYV
jgi:uncharacterized membrane protein